jgi:hypothetical protein
MHNDKANIIIIGSCLESDTEITIRFKDSKYIVRALILLANYEVEIIFMK